MQRPGGLVLEGGHLSEAGPPRVARRRRRRGRVVEGGAAALVVVGGHGRAGKRGNEVSLVGVQKRLRKNRETTIHKYWIEIIKDQKK